MNRKIDVVEKEEVETDLKDEDEEGCADPKEVQSLEEVDDPDSLEEDYVERLRKEQLRYEQVHAPDTREQLELLEKGSFARQVFKNVAVQDLASRLKDNSEVVGVSRKILEHIKDGNDDVKSFSGMVNQVLENKSFCEELPKTGQNEGIRARFIGFGFTTQHKRGGIAVQLSRIRRDNLFSFPTSAQEFFKETLEEGDSQMVVRGALSILFPYCISASYMEEKGFWDDSLWDKSYQIPPRS